MKECLSCGSSRNNLIPIVEAGLESCDEAYFNGEYEKESLTGEYICEECVGDEDTQPLLYSDREKYYYARCYNNSKVAFRTLDLKTHYNNDYCHECYKHES